MASVKSLNKVDGSSQYAVEFIDVEKTFYNKNKRIQKALDNVSFNIEKGKITALLGSSGAGKTTTARIINGMETYDKGQVIINGVLLTDKTQKKIRKKTAFVFQQFNLFPNMSVLKNIIYAPINVYKFDKQQTIEKANKLLKQFGLEDKADYYPNDLSGGQKQRVAIIRALILEPEILIMDEPTASLDPELTNEVINMIKEINKTGLTIVIITHDIIVAKKATDNILMMYGGQCVDCLPTAVFFDKNSKKSVYGQRFLEMCE